MNHINSLSYQEILKSTHHKNVNIKNNIRIDCSSSSFTAEEWFNRFSQKIADKLLPSLKILLDSNSIHIEYSPIEVDLISILMDCSNQTKFTHQFDSRVADIIKVGFYSQLKFRGELNHQRNLDYKDAATNEHIKIFERILAYFSSLGLNPSNCSLVEYQQNGFLAMPTLIGGYPFTFSNTESARRAIGFRIINIQGDPENIFINQKVQVNALEINFIFSESALRVHLSFDPEFFSNEDVNRFINEINNVVLLKKLSIGCKTPQSTIDFIQNGDFLKKIYNNALSNFDKEIIRYGKKQYSWKDIIIRSAGIAKGLKLYNIESNYCALMLEPSVDFVCVALGIIMAGKTYVPISVKFGRSRLLEILGNSDVKYCITNSNEFSKDEEFSHYMISLNDLYSATLGWEEALRSFNFDCTNNFIYRLHTSGSTGTPKAVDITYNNYIALLESYDEFLPDFQSLNWAFTGSPVFDSSTKQYLFPLLNNTLIFLPTVSVDESLGKCCDEMVRNQVDVLNMTPALIKLAINSGTDISTFKYILTGGEALSSELYQEILKKTGKNNLLNMYGPTEATVNSTGHIGSSDILFYESLPIGKNLKHALTCVVNSELKALPMGCQGELLISGALLTNGYPNDLAKTKEKFILLNGDVWYKTGDQVIHWFDDNLYFIGRNDNQIKINGVRIELGEISSRLSKISNINFIDVIFKNNRIYVFFLKKDGIPIPNEFDLYTEAKFLLPHYIAIGKFIQIDKTPLTVQGKTDKQALIKILDELNESVPIERTTNITDKTELAIYNIISSVLITKDIPLYEINKSLIDHGVDSLSSLEILVTLENELGLTADAKSIVYAESLIEISNILQSKYQNITSGWNQINNKDLIIVLFPPVLGDPAIFRELEDNLAVVNASFIYCTYPGLTRPADRPKSILTLAEYIAQEIELSCPENSKIIFLAYSMGCLVATEVAQHLVGKRVITNIILLDKGPYNSIINNTLALQQNDSLRFLRASIKNGSQVNGYLLSQLEEYVKHNTYISFNHHLKKIEVKTKALCLKCTIGGESFYNEDWHPYFSKFSLHKIDCDHGQIVHGNWAAKISKIIINDLCDIVI